MSDARGIAHELLQGVARMLLAMLCLCGAALADDSVSLQLEAFGGVGAFRPGDMVGVRVGIRNTLEAPMECLLQWDLPNADGDTVAHARSVTVVPSQPTQRWLYARLPPAPAAIAANQVFTLRLFEMRDGRRVREMAALRFKPAEAAQPPMPVDLTEGLIAVVGDGRMGLETMAATVSGNDVPAMQEVTRIARGLKPTSLPDRWEGLASCETIIWCGTAAPQDLGNDRALALNDWVERGGHLVIVLPENGDAWSLRAGRGHNLSELLPTQGIRRCDAIELSTLMPLLGKSTSLRRGNASMPLTAFDPSVLDRGWQPLITLPSTPAKDTDGQALQGCALAAQRLLGHGRVTLVGLDLDALHRQSLNADGLPQVDTFWNCVLGRRADAPTETNYRDWAEQDKPTLASSAGGVRYAAGTGELVSGQIGRQGRAAAGVLSVMALFVAYWLLAVPVCWVVLRRIKRARWAWPTFAVLAALATLPAWMLGLFFGGSGADVRHLSVVDYVLQSADDGPGDRPRLLRATSWMSAALSGFGTASMQLEGDAAQRNLLIDWSPPPSGNAQRFPDTARTERAVDVSSQLLLPSRSTTVDVQAQWLGAPPRDWGRVVWEDAELPIRTKTTEGASPMVSLDGTLWHGLPGPLRDVTLIHVGPWRYQSRSWAGPNDQRIEPSDYPPRTARMVRLAADWKPGPLDVGRALYPDGGLNPAVVGDGSFVREIRNLYADPLRARGNFASLRTGIGDPFEPDAWRKQLAMLGLYQMLKPPDYRVNPPAAADTVVVRVQRQLGRELDLSAWFTRPCLIVTGFLDDSSCPVPLRIDGRTPTSRGNVMVRCILPLPCETAGSVIPVETVP